MIFYNERYHYPNQDEESPQFFRLVLHCFQILPYQQYCYLQFDHGMYKPKILILSISNKMLKTSHRMFLYQHNFERVFLNLSQI